MPYLKLFTILTAIGTMSLSAASRWDIVFTQLPAGQTVDAVAPKPGVVRSAYGEGGRLVLLGRDGSERTLTTQFQSAADPAVSFDGKRILFAGKRSASEHWNIFEMNVDGSALHQITHDLGDCRSPVYQPPIFYLDDPGPMPQIAFVSTPLTGFGDLAATSVYSARMDGSGVRRLTYNPSGAFDPTMLPDGRMLFSAWERDDSSQEPGGRIELLATNIDGTDYATFSGKQGRRVKHMACVTARRLVIFVDAGTVQWDGAGRLGVIDLRRNLHSYRQVTAPAAYLYHSPSPLPDGSILVSRRAANGRGTLGIVRLDPATGQSVPVFDDPKRHDIQAQALVPRAVPDGRSSVVDEKQPWAKLYCLNVYETDLEQRIWTKGLVKRIRVLEGLPRPTGGSDRGCLSGLLRKRFLGEVDVDEDGSFHLQIPANLPVQMQALDSDGIALRSSAWIWAKNKEQRGCIGCHEDGERTPENHMASALLRPAAMLMLPPERRRSVEFERDVAPILAQKCATAACHAGPARPKLAGQVSRFSTAYEALLAKDPRTGKARYVTPGVARTSPLTWVIFGRNTSRPWDGPTSAARPAPMPPADASPLTAIEKRAIVEWIDLGAHYCGMPGNRGEPIAGGGQP